MINDILGQEFLGNTIQNYAVCLGVFLLSVIAAVIFESMVLKRMRLLAEKTKTTVDDYILNSVKKQLMPFFYIIILYLCARPLIHNESLHRAVRVTGLIVLTGFGVRFILSIIIFSLKAYWLSKEKDESKTEAINGIVVVVKFAVWSLAVIVLMDNLGIEITTLIAGLGIGGVAIALAAQVLLGDLFSYFSIFFDKPFEIGDFIIIDNYMGVVEHIGIKTSRIRSLSGEQLIFSNTDLTNSRVRNYKRMGKRRVAFNIGVTYQTGTEHLQDIPVIIKDIIRNIQDTEFDRAHFFSYGDFSLVFEIVYYVMGSDYNKYMDIQQEINLAVKREFEKRRIEFAYPTQTLFIDK
ncbi:MAG: mechanosensitive ion channel family protein [Elusimicrobiota bacterium]